jgi:iron complex outermembrane receptor protein
MELVIVTPNRFVASPENSTVDVTVITADDIEQSAAKTLPELLSLQAGIQVRSNDGTPDMAIDLRGFGMTGNQNTLVLLDGQPLNDIQLTSIRWSAIPLESIDRIEIMNGSGSVLYGGGATGGTINIITKHPGKEMRGNAGIGLGSYDTREWQLALSGSGDSVGMRVTASGMDSSNYRANNDFAQKSLEADLRTSMGHGDAIIKFGADVQNLRYPGTRTVDPSIGMNELVTDPRGTSTPLDYGKRDSGHASIGTVQQVDFARLAGELSYRDTKQQAYYAAYGESYLDTDLDLLSFTPRVKMPYRFGSSGNELIVGADLADWDYDSIRSTSPTALGTPTAHIMATQSNRALYAQNTTQFDSNTKVTFGIRSQRVDYQASDTVNPAPYASGKQGHTANAYELGLRYGLNKNLSLFGRIGRSFRIATVDEIFDQYGGGFPLYDSKITILEPQTSLDIETGFDYKSVGDRVRAALFQMNLNNEIHYNAITFTNMNLAPTRRYGLELEGAHNFTDTLEITAAYSYTVAKFREGIYGGVNVSGNDIPLVPRHRLALSSSWKISEQDNLDANAMYVGEQHFDNDQANTYGENMPAYTTVDLKLSHREGSWLLAAALNNLFNRHYFTYGIASTSTPGKYNAYPMQERNISLNAKYNF